MSEYFVPRGGHPDQSHPLNEQAIFTDAYVFIPKGSMMDIVVSYLPFWEKTRAWILARPLSGFAETFSQYIMEVAPGGGSTRPDDDQTAQAVLFVVGGTGKISINREEFDLKSGSYTYIPPNIAWEIQNIGDASLTFHWIRKSYEPVDGIDAPTAFVTHEQEISPNEMPDTNGNWSTTRFVDPEDLRHDMHVNIVNFQPGGVIPFMETHVMEHGLYVLQGTASYRLNNDWVDVEAGDFMWLRAFCPQACRATGTEPFRYLLYKDVNRHAKLSLK